MRIKCRRYEIWTLNISYLKALDNGICQWLPILGPDVGPDIQIKFGSEGMMIPFGTAPKTREAEPHAQHQESESH